MLHVHRMMVYIFFFKINILGYVSPTKKKKKNLGYIQISQLIMIYLRKKIILITSSPFI